MTAPTTMWNKSFICIVIANLTLCLGHASVNPLVASYTKYLDTTPEMTGFLSGMFFIISFACHPFAGPAMTKLDKRKLLIVVFLLGAIANTGYAIFHSVPAFMIFRFFSGAQYSLVGPLLLALSADHLPPDKLAYGLGIYGIGGAIGNAVAPSVGATILGFGTTLKSESLGYTLLFLFGTVIFILSVIPSYLIAPDKKTKEQLADVGVWYKSIFTIKALPAAIVLLLLMAAYALINTYIFEFTKEQGIGGASLFYLVLAAALAVSRPICGYLTNKVGINRIVFPALIVFALAMVIIGSSKSLPVAMIGAILAALGYGASQPSLQALGMQATPALLRGVATNTMYMGIDMGLFLGPYLGGLVYARSTYSFIYKVGAIPVILAIICLALTLPTNKRWIKEADLE